jgi:competence protein ComEC
VKLVWVALFCWLTAATSVFASAGHISTGLAGFAASTLFISILIIVQQLRAKRKVATALLSITGATAVLLSFSSIQLGGQIASKIAMDYKVLDAKFEVQDLVKASQSTFAGPPNQTAHICILEWGVGETSKPGAGCGTLTFDQRDLVKSGLVASAKLAFKPPRSASEGLFRARIESGSFTVIRQNQSIYVFDDFKQQFASNASGVSADAVALVLGLGIGDDSRLSQATADQMKSLSLTHLTAVSGANCAIVLGGVFYLTTLLAIKRWPRFLVATIALCSYVLLVGQQPSVLRAGVMALVVLLAMTLGRGVSPISALALSVSGLLIANPLLSVQYGFALSVAATAGLLILAPAMAKVFQRRLPNWLALSLAVSVSAQLVCFPILLQLQAGFSTYSVLANLAAEAVVAPVTVLCILACLVFGIAPWLSAALVWLASLGTQWIVLVSSFFSTLPLVNLPWPSGVLGTLVAALMALSVFLMLRARPLIWRAVGATFSLLLIAVGVGSASSAAIKYSGWPSPDWRIVNCDVGQGDGLVFRSAGLVAVIDVGREPRKIDSCLNRLGVSRIDLLVLTHYDMDHVGGLSGALSGRSVVRAMITPFRDDRPGAEITMRELEKVCPKIEKAETGMQGRFGASNWLVLSPHHGAPEAEDSNDGSVTMLVTTEDFNLVLLADLGEKGQLRLAEEWQLWSGQIVSDLPVILKVAHHGSADMLPELYEALNPSIALVSVGANNSYGHPTKRTLDVLNDIRSKILRTDQLGAIAVSKGQKKGQLAVSVSGGG